MAALDFPNSPTVGQTFVGGGMTWRWNGTIWALAGNSATTAGRVAYAEVLVSQSNIGGTTTPLNGLSVTWTADPSRTYRISGVALFQWTVANCGAELDIYDTAGAGVRKQAAAVQYLKDAWGTSVPISVIESGLSGPQTRRLQAMGLGNTVAMLAAPGVPAYILVEDITFQPGGGGGGAGGGSGFTYTQETAPTGMVHGATWHDASTGISYVYVVDANSSQWVQFAPGAGGSALGTVFHSTFPVINLVSGSANPATFTTPGSVTFLTGAEYVCTLGISALQGVVTQCSATVSPFFQAWWNKPGGAWGGFMVSHSFVGTGATYSLTTINLGDPGAAVNGGGAGNYFRIERVR